LRIVGEEFEGSMSKMSKKSSKTRRWSATVTKHSDALDLQPQVFKEKDPHRIALSLKRSAERSKRTQGDPISISDVDVEFLHKSCREKSASKAKTSLRKRQGRIAGDLRPTIIASLQVS
jgi:hypothetical protein